MQKLSFKKVGVHVLVGEQSGHPAPGIVLREEEGAPVCVVFTSAGPRVVHAKWGTDSGDLNPGECVEHAAPAAEKVKKK